MSAEIIGTGKIFKYIDRYEFKKIKLSRGTEPVYLKRATDNDSKETLIADFADWVDEFIDSDNYKDYKLELFGTYSTSPDAKLSPVVKVTVAFNSRAAVTGTAEINQQKTHSPSMDVNKYVDMAVELATVRAQNERLEEKLDELLEELDNPDEVGTTAAPKNIGEAVQEAIIGKADRIIDALLIYFANSGSNNKPTVQSYAPAINGVDSPVLDEFKQVYPDIEQDLERLLILAKTKPDFFKMLITQLRSIV
jgi:hypothetical protein